MRTVFRLGCGILCFHLCWVVLAGTGVFFGTLFQLWWRDHLLQEVAELQLRQAFHPRALLPDEEDLLQATADAVRKAEELRIRFGA